MRNDNWIFYSSKLEWRERIRWKPSQTHCTLHRHTNYHVNHFSAKKNGEWMKRRTLAAKENWTDSKATERCTACCMQWCFQGRRKLRLRVSLWFFFLLFCYCAPSFVWLMNFFKATIDKNTIPTTKPFTSTFKLVLVKMRAKNGARMEFVRVPIANCRF